MYIANGFVYVYMCAFRRMRVRVYMRMRMRVRHKNRIIVKHIPKFGILKWNRNLISVYNKILWKCTRAHGYFDDIGWKKRNSNEKLEVGKNWKQTKYQKRCDALYALVDFFLLFRPLSSLFHSLSLLIIFIEHWKPFEKTFFYRKMPNLSTAKIWWKICLKCWTVMSRYCSRWI